MANTRSTIVTPSQPTIIEEAETKGVYEIEGLYPGYGHTLGNSLRRIILSSLEGAAITTVKIDDVSHEFSTIKGIKEDVITVLLNLRKVRIKLHAEGPQELTVSKKGSGDLVAGDLAASNSSVEIVNPDQHIATLTDKSSSINMEVTVENGLGFVSKEELKKDKVDIGVIALDAVFTPIRKVSYEVENMRVGDRTDFNKLRIAIETDGTITPRESLERAIDVMIDQLKAIVGFREEDEANSELSGESGAEDEIVSASEAPDAKKVSIDDVGLSTRTHNALSNANIRTLGGLSKKKENDLLELEGLGEKGVEEIKEILASHDLTLKE